jgi:DeoR/GlpR family transcriptional regulator of sugar metabolism
MEANFISGTDRQIQIQQLISRQQRISIAEICERFSISTATARRDLEALALDGKIQRVHGGAIAMNQAPAEMPLLQRQGEQAEEKMRIGQVAAELVPDGGTVFLGSGTTVLEVARNLRSRQHLTVITNSLSVVNVLAGLENITLICLGGLLRDSELSFIGHLTEQALAEVRADQVIIGTHAINLEQGLTNDYLPETMTDRAILKLGRQVIVVVDHTKFGRVSTARLAPIESIHTLVTSLATAPDLLKAVQDCGVQVILA